MNIAKTKIGYKFARTLPMLAFAGGTVAMSGCNHKELIEQHDVTLKINADNFDEVYPFSKLDAHIKDPSVKNIYIVPEQGKGAADWGTYTGKTINNLRTYLLEPALQMSSSVTGRGDFPFTPGQISEDDSLFLVRNNWTVNKRLLDAKGNQR